MSEENNGAKPQGKGLAVTGFVLGLVGIVLLLPIMAVALGMGSAGVAWFWVVLCAVGLLLSIMGTMKLGKTGGKKGLGIAGIIVGGIALIWAVTSTIALADSISKMSDAWEEVGNIDVDDINDMLNQ